MGLLEAEIYQESKAIKLGKRKKNRLLKDLSDWFTENYNVEILNYRYGKYPNSERYRLDLIIDDFEEYIRMAGSFYRGDPESLFERDRLSKNVISAYREITQKNKQGIEVSPEDIGLFFICFSEKAKEKACEDASSEVSTFFLRKYSTRRVNSPKVKKRRFDVFCQAVSKKYTQLEYFAEANFKNRILRIIYKTLWFQFCQRFTYSPSESSKSSAADADGDKSLIWDVYYGFGEYVIFYFKNEDVKKNEQHGISDKLRDEFYEIIKQYDELNYYSMENLDLSFDSKQNFDEKYNGRWDYYMRR